MGEARLSWALEQDHDRKVATLKGEQHAVNARKFRSHPLAVVSIHRSFRFGSAVFLAGICCFVASGCGGGADKSAREETPAFHTPRSAAATAPETFVARFETTRGNFDVRVDRDWAPLGADRFFTLVTSGYYDDVRIYRVVEGFMAEWGLHGDARVTTLWRRYAITDDPVVESNLKGRLSFAAHGPNSRTVQVFVNLDDNPGLDAQGFSPFGEVVEGMDVIESFYAEYGDGPPRGEGPYQARALARGNAYLDVDFPNLDSAVRAYVVEPAPTG